MKKRTQNLKPFSRLSAAEKRVAIAQDVLAQIKTETYLMRRGVWAGVEVDIPDAPEVKQPNTINQNLLTGKIPPVVLQPKLTCRCCGVGAAFLSSVRLANACSIQGDEVDKKASTRQLKKYFSMHQIALVEVAFEQGGNGMGVDDCPSYDSYSKAKEFGLKYDNHEERAIAIFTNIVKNKGKFTP